MRSAPARAWVMRWGVARAWVRRWAWAMRWARAWVTRSVAWAVVVASALCVALWEAGTIGSAAFLLTPFGYGHPSLSPGLVAPAAFALVAAGLVVAGGAGFARRDLLA
ncbi:hypothetical protein [Nonomuraea sp. NPDC050202]|uniref:hypothetical protein n=1 Tax=Nonomuraea sp. NPDC050202 TaxID=3155035 RepID=UPI0033C572FF